MAVFKATQNRSDSDGKFKATERRSYDSALVYDWETRNKEAYDALEKYRQRINSGGYLSADDLTAYRKALDSYVATSTSLRGLSKGLGQGKDDDNQWTKTIADMESGYRGISDYFSQWKTEVDFRAAMEQAKAYEKRMAELTNGYDPTKNQQEGMTGWDDFQAYLDRTKNQQQAQAKEKTVWDTILEGIAGIGSDTSLPGIGGSQVAAMSEEAQRNDTELAFPKDRWTDDERYRFGYLWNTERQKAWDYARAVNLAYAKQDENAKIQGIQKSATDNFWAGAGHTLGAIATSPLGMADYLKDLITYGAVGYSPQADGEISPFEYSQAVTSGVAQHLNDAGGTINDNIPILGGKGWGDVYGLGTSIAQSSLAAYTGGSGQALITFFGSAAASGVDDALSRGADGTQALFYGTSVGAAEALAEMAGIDNLLKIGASAGKQLLFTLVKQAGAEGMEEGLTTFLGNVADQVWLGDKSNFYLRVQAYMSAGFSESEAKSKAWSELWGELAFDALGGFVSGGIHAGPQTAYHTFMQNSYAKNTYGGSQKELVGEALEINPDNAFAKKMQGRLDSGKNLSGGQLNALVQQNEATISEQDMASIQKAAAQRMTELGATENVEATAAALAKQAAGQELSHKEKQLINEYGSVVSQEMNPENIRSGKYNAEWAQKIGTNKINANEYSRSLMALAQEQTRPKSSRTNPAGQSEENAPAADTVDTTKESGAESDSEADTGPAKFKSIASIKNKRATLAMEDGTEADARDVDLDPDDGVRIETIASIDGISSTDANFILKTLRENTGASAQMDALGAKDAYRYGFYGFSKDLMTKQAVFANSLTQAQRDAIYEAGQKARQSQIEKAAPKTIAKQRGVYFDYGGGNVVAFKDADKGAMTEEKRKAGVQVAMILNKLGIGGSIYFFESYRNEKDQLVYKDSNGKEVKAPNGWYSEKDGSIHIDLNSGRAGNGLVLYTLSHELTHFIEQWSPKKYKVLADFLIENYEKGQSMDALVRKKQASLSAMRGEKVSYDEAYSEVIADSMEAMLSDGNVLEKLIELKAKDQSLFMKMKQFFDDLLTKIRNAYKGLTPDSAEGKAVQEMTDAIERIQQLFADALVDASENFQASLTPGEEGTVVNESGEPVAHATSDGTIQLSMRTYEEDGKKAFRDYLNKCVKNDRLTQAEMQEMLNGIEEIYQVCKEFKDKYAPFSTWSDAAVVRDTYGKPVFSVVTPNGDYKMNLDFSLVCKKRRTLDAVFNEMSKRGIIDDFELGQKSVVKINEIIRKYGLETACALCFVDAKRFRQASMADQFTNLYNELVLSLVPDDQRGNIDRFNFAGYDTIKKVNDGIHTWDKSRLDFSHLDEVMKNYGKGTVEHKAAKYIKTHAEGRRLLLRGDFMSSKGFDAVKTQNKDILKLYNSKKGTGGPKAAFGDVQYMNEIIKKSKSWTPEKAYAVGGVRIQSFSDYVPRMVFDYVQMIYDLAATKLPAHAYTKESLFVKQFGLTGVKINMSLIPAIAEGGIAPGLDANGNYVWAGESFDFETAKEIQNADGYTENCGTICVGVSYQHIIKLLSDPEIRMVIPYHKSGLNPIVAHMNKIAEFTDYTSLLTNPGGCQNTMDKNGSKVAVDFNFNEVLHKTGDPKATVRQYLDWCAKHEYKPRFAEFAWHENYYKLIEDFTLYDKDGNYVPQREVRAVFPTKDSAFGSMKELIQSGLEEDAIVEGKRDSSLSSIVDEIQNTLPKTEAEISEEQVAQADHDLEEVKNSDRNYSYEALTSKPDMMVTDVGGNVPKNRADVVAVAKKNAASVGRFDPKTGSVSVHVNDMDVDVLLGTDGLKHGLRRTKDAQNDANYIVTVKAGEILKNSIKVNEITPKKHNATGSYVLIGIAKNASGDMYIVRSVVNQFNNELASMDVLYAINAKKELAATKSPRSTAEPLSVTSSSISITELLDIVNQHFPDILPEDVLKHYGYDARPEGDLGENVLYSDRDYQNVVSKAVETFGTTTDFAEAGFILPNGKMLKFTDDNHSGERQYDHRAIGIAYGVDVDLSVNHGFNYESNNYLNDFVENGGIRFDPGSMEFGMDAGMQLSKSIPITKEQEMAIRDFVEWKKQREEMYNSDDDPLSLYDGPLTLHIDFGGGAGFAISSSAKDLDAWGVKHLTYEGGQINASRIIADIRYYYRTGETRQQSSVAQFRYSDRDTESVSNRSLLANAFEGIAKNDLEKRKIQEYKSQIDQINAEERKLSDLRRKIKDLSFAKGKRETEAIRALRDEATKTANRINTMDKILLRLEASKPLQDVLQREKKMAYDLAKQKGEEALAAYRLKAEAKQSETLRDYRETRAALRQTKSDAAVMEREFIRIAKAYEKLDAKSTAKTGKDAKTIADLKAALKEEAQKHRDDQKTWEAEFNRLVREYEASGRSIAKLEEKIELQKANAKARVEGREKTAMRHKIKGVVNELNSLLMANDKKRHVPESLKKAVADALTMVNMDNINVEKRIADINTKLDELYKKKAELDRYPNRKVEQEEVQSAIDDQISLLDRYTKMGDRMKRLHSAYEEIQHSDDPDIANAYDPVIAESLKELSGSIGNTPLIDMSIEQLSDVYDMYKMVLTRIRDANKALQDNIKENIGKLASDTVAEIKFTGGQNKYRVSLLDPVKKFLWDNMKPVYAMEYIGSSTLTKLFNNVRSGEDVWANDVTEARKYFLEKAKKHDYFSWDFDKKYRFVSEFDAEFELTLEQILSLYAYSKRDQAHDHLRLGGFVFDSNIETYKEKDDKTGKRVLKYKVNTADAHQISINDLAAIIGTLSKEQAAFVDEMQDYLSTVMGAKGNEVTMKMYGVKLFKEKFYFPLKSAKQFMFEQNEVSGEVRIKNSGFTNKVVAKANNPVILSNFMDVWSGHVNDMAMYHSFVLPLEDFNRVFNYTSSKKEGQPSVSVKGTLQSAYTPAAVSYVRQLITDLNSGARSDPTTGVISKLIGLHKKGAVFASLSVVVQQPSAIARAAALVDTKYFIGPKVDSLRHKDLWAEVKQYAPVAIIKEMGYFDTNMGKSTQDYITGQEYSGFKARMKALVTDSNYRDEILSKAPALADEIAWCSIWEAVKRETKAKHPSMDVGSDAFLKMVGERFTEVITKTQVYDSVLSRSAMMRSKDTGMKMVTSFMAEPTTSINMVFDALLQGKRGNRKYCRTTIGAVVASQIINSILVSFVYAARDDDEDETYAEKYIGRLTQEVLDSLNPATYLPFIKDIVSIAQGYDVERADMSIISDLWKAWQKLSSDNLSVYQKVEAFGGSIAQLFGLPVKNIMRDVRGIYQTIMSFVTGPQTTAAGIGYAVKDAIPEWLGGGETSKQDKLYDAYLSGDKTQIARAEGAYKDQSAINSAIRKALRENDPRILKAAQAVMNGNGIERANIAREIAAEGHFDLQDIQAAINAEIDKLRKEAKDN